MASTAPESAAVSTSNLTKSFPIGLGRRRRPALEDLTVVVPRGEVFGYLGPNGSGKTTTLKLLLGLVRPDRGTATILGYPLEDRAWRYAVGYQPEQPYFYDYLRAPEYLDYAGRLFGMSAPARRQKAQALLERVGLSDAVRLPLRSFSKGMTQRLGLAQALMNDPELLFLDEPMSGLDPIGRRFVRDLILELKAEGKTIFFSTHILPDAEALCDRIGLLRAGRLVKVGRLDEILTLDVGHMEVLVSGLAEGAAEGLAPAARTRRMGERWRLEIEEKELIATLEAVRARGGRVLSVQPVRQSLEEYFFAELSPGRPQGPWAGEA